MSAINLINVKDLSPAELCNFIQRDYYNDIKELFKSIHNFTDKIANDGDTIGHWELLSLLFSRLENKGELIKYLFIGLFTSKCSGNLYIVTLQKTFDGGR